MLKSASPARPSISAVLQRYWGYKSLRPLQQDAIQAGIDQRDSLVVMPTGGGKSLCYQIPPMVTGRTDVVVSPLISLMKDQVDALRACGYEAAAIHSGITEQERGDIARAMAAGMLRLVFVSPERLLTPWFVSLMKRANVTSFAIDEAHCISQWGHDFRPEYRRMAELRQHFPEASIHAFTATATQRVRQDIIDQLQLREPSVLVGRFDRPNLTYRVLPRFNVDSQLLESVVAHKGEAVIVYCISRADTERVSEMLRARGVKAAPYHAGLDARTRARTQEAFTAEKLDVVVATVAFGMGIDRSNVRCVIHAAMPKSIEHYQQETGRSGRDGLEAECLLFFSGSDYRRWESLMRRRSEETEQPPEFLTAQLALLSEMYNFGTAQVCRHKQLSEYFGQAYEGTDCKACDVCLNETPELEGGDEIAREVIECVEALRYPFGVGYVVDVLRGASTDRIKARRHNELPQYGSLRRLPREQLQRIVFQMVDLGLLDRSEGEMPVLSVTRQGKLVAVGKAGVSIKAPPAPASTSAARASDGWQGVDRGLFEALRELRRIVADERGVPPFIVFGDAVLRDMARSRPTTIAALGNVRGVGERKLADLGARFVEAIASYLRENRMTPGASGAPPRAPSGSAAVNLSKSAAFQLFDQGTALDEVAKQTGKARSTVSAYLEEYIAQNRPAGVRPWVDDALYNRIEAAARRMEGNFLRPVYDALGGKVGYEDIRIVMKHMGVR